MAMSKGEIILKHVDSGSKPAASITQADQLSCQRKDHSAAGAFAAICPCETGSRRAALLRRVLRAVRCLPRRW